ncbi:hypothetical protein CAPTEDRAFT_226486 [Capitella teleta]|uniref:Uncharacterized protein n=1 Tax=Capitella teleta TaxID=283909 RepID=R7UBU2_CAPTE|nr:hypothetical protein CAPTEDRAFT_226486 [Capitella teleta]|eukprot:ELU03845.1 hypothetical protein CAPTEDRAFT_226486 [Capitella teleta]
MVLQYIKNHMGMKLTEEQMADIPHAFPELVSHVIIKNIQAFGMLGTFLVGPVWAASSKSTRNLPGLAAKCTKAGRVGVVMSFFTGPAMTYFTVKGNEEIKIYDRCFRLRHNRKQVRVDQASIIGGLSGAAIGASQANPTLGFLVGMTSGVLGAAAYNSKQDK